MYYNILVNLVNIIINYSLCCLHFYFLKHKTHHIQLSRMVSSMRHSQIIRPEFKFVPCMSFRRKIFEDFLP